MLYATVLGSERQNNKKKIIVERHTAVCVYLIEVVALALLFNSTFFAAKLPGKTPRQNVCACANFGTSGLHMWVPLPEFI